MGRGYEIVTMVYLDGEHISTESHPANADEVAAILYQKEK